MKRVGTVGLASCIVSTFVILALAASDERDQKKSSLPEPDKDGWISLFNGKDLTGWKFRNPNAKKLWIAMMSKSQLSTIAEGSTNVPARV